MPDGTYYYPSSPTYNKSGALINAKTRASLLENQLMAIAITRIEERPFANGELEARLYPGELKYLVSDQTHIYRDLKKAAKAITGHSMILEDGKGNFKAFSLVPNADYIDGTFVIKFNQEIKPHILALEGGYTPLNLSVMTSFQKNASFRIYELLKNWKYKCNPKVNGGRFDIEYNLFEFRFLLGIANIDNVDVQKRLEQMNGDINWEELYRILEERGAKGDLQYRATDKLQKDCIDIAQAELEEKSDVRFEYELVRLGLSYRKIVFHIYPNVPLNAKEINERKSIIESMRKPDRQLEIPYDTNQKLYDDFVGFADVISKEDIDMLMIKAAYNEEIVRDAFEYVKTKNVTDNVVGYLVRAVENHWVNEPTVDNSAEKAKVLNEVKKDYEANKESIAVKVWNDSKRNEDFSQFEDFLYINGLNIDIIEATYGAASSLKMYLNFKTNKDLFEGIS